MLSLLRIVIEFSWKSRNNLKTYKRNYTLPRSLTKEYTSFKNLICEKFHDFYLFIFREHAVFLLCRMRNQGELDALYNRVSSCYL